MAEKYQARDNNINKNDFNEINEKEKQEESGAKVAKVVAKAAGQYFAPGVGGKVVDLAAKTKVGQAVLNRAGKNLVRNPMIGSVAKTLDDSGAVDLADSATSLVGGAKTGSVSNTSSSSLNSVSDSFKNSSLLPKEGLDETSSDKKSNSKSLLDGFLGNDSLNMFLPINKKFVIIGCAGFFIVLLFIVALFAGKDFANLDLTNNSSMAAGSNALVEGQVLGTEPDPQIAINYWSELNIEDYVFLKDDVTNLPLGAWPKNYESIPNQLTNYTEYNGFVWPVTPIDNIYTFVYNHNGIDIKANFGMPIYSPVDGLLDYSEWGHTDNTGSDETAYSVSILLDNPITYEGVEIKRVFLTHFSGIRYRCSDCNQKVVKGELLGYVGNAAGSASEPGWVPHLHMTFYGDNYDEGLTTDKIENLYGIETGAIREAGK